MLASKKPCPCCEGSLVFILCPDCDSLLGWCAESDCAIGHFEGTQLALLGTGQTRQWARDGCALCGSHRLRPATRDDLARWSLETTAREVGR